MKKIFLSIAAVMMAAGIMSAQDINSVTEVYNNGAMELEMGNKEAALGYFQSALTAAEALGEEGAQIAENCKNTIPVLMGSIAKDLIKAEQFDAALEQLNKTIETAELFGNTGEAEEAKTLIGQTLMAKGNDMINSKNFAGAIEVYNQIMAADPTNAMAALRLGMAYGATGNTEDAEKAYLVAAENGQDKNAFKQLSNLFVKKAAAVLKTKKYDEAINYALKSNEYLENATAMKVAGTAASALKKNEEAIQYLEKYLELSPNAKDAAQMKYTIAATAQIMGDNAKAKEYYQAILSDPKFGPTAKQMLESIK
ncbi:MAG: tetratricopeptide repeat protein [Bacteroidales bacterium]|nr:tetratricopeptide repeat protein [Bacteroidales bacterium]